MTIELLNIDCMEYMATCEDNAFDLAIVDPPYGIKRSGQTKTTCKNPKHNRKQYKQKDWDNERPPAEYWEQLFRVSKHQIVWGANYFTDYLPPSMGWIFWDKGQDLSMSDGELAYTSFEKALRRVIKNRGAIQQDGAIHPTQKPIYLYRWCLQKYAEKGMKILDTHGGSHSNAIACDLEGFDLDIIEIDKEYFDDGLNAFDMHKRQLKLF